MVAAGDVYVGTEHGDLYAVDAATGEQVWHRTLGSVSTSCDDLPGGVFGVSGTPAEDAGRIYVAASNRSAVLVYALDLATGRTVPGWPVRISDDPEHMHVWGALTLFRGRLYATMAGVCDIPPYYGRVVAIDTANAKVVAQWSAVHDNGVVGGGGIWGYGGAAVDPADGNVYVATGNALYPEKESQPDAESVVRLTRGLRTVAANAPGGLRGFDLDFGATPILFHPSGCPPELAAENKNGVLFVYRRDHIERGPLQRLRITGNNSELGFGLFIGLPAYWPAGRLLYVSTPGPDHPPLLHGLVALRVGSDCRLRPDWQATVGPSTVSPVSSPTVAGGVVYYGDGMGDQVRAFDARTGAFLWDSGGVIDGPVYAPPVVSGGRLFVAAWTWLQQGALYAFGL